VLFFCRGRTRPLAMTQRGPRIRFALPAMVECLERFGLTGGLAKPNALLEQIWNTLPRLVLAASHTSANCHLRNFFQRIDADNPSNTAYFPLLFSCPLIPARWDELTKGHQIECLD